MSNKKNTDKNAPEVEATTTPAVEEASVAPVAAEKMVTIRGITNHKCRIAGNVYQFRNQEELKVPESVAMVLAQARKAIKL